MSSERIRSEKSESKKEKTSTERPFFLRSPRLVRELPKGEMEIEAAPALQQRPEINWLSVLLPPIGMFALMAIMMNISNGSMSYGPYMFIFSGSMMVISMVVSITNYRRQVRRFNQYKTKRKEEYEKYLGNKRKELAELGDEQRKILERVHPTPAECIEIIKSTKRRLWERMYSDDDFMKLRIGTGNVPLSVSIKTPQIGFVIEEDHYLRIPAEIAKVSDTVKDAAVFCDMKNLPRCGVSGDYNRTAALVRSMIIQAVTHHGYDEVKIVGLFDNAHKDDWKWLRFLPHIFNMDHTTRYLSFDEFHTEKILKTIEEIIKHRMDIKRDSENVDKQYIFPYYLFVIDNFPILGNHPIWAVLSECDSSMNCGYIIMAGNIASLPRSIQQIVRLGSDADVFYVKNNNCDKNVFTPDRIGVVEADLCARKLAPIRLISTETKDGKLPDNISFLEGFSEKFLKVSKVAMPEQLRIEENWKYSEPSDKMEVPIGIDLRGKQFVFDINEKKHGPHGLVAGMTGYGKTEMVQTWILAMSVMFSPQDVSFVLIDFKGTGLILPFKKLPHLAGTISDIDRDISRNLVALRAELQRRKELFDQTGTSNIVGYRQLYREGKVKEPLSYLFVVIDEYAEFKANFPDFTSEVNSLFRTGRALGVQIIVMTQNPSGVISAESESNVHFRWCLKVANAAASKEILGGHPDASQIMQPGRAFIRVGEDEVFEPIQSLFSGAKYSAYGSKKEVSVNVVDFSGERIKLSGMQRTVKGELKEIDGVVEYIHRYASDNNISNAREIWKEPLPSIINMELNIPDEQPGILNPIVGMLDDPATQTQYPFSIPISQNGHVFIFGAPGSGKTTFLQTLTMSLCMKYTPDEVNIYMMDFGSWGMGIFNDFPQIGAIANSNEDQKIEKIISFLDETLDKRKKKFANEHVGSIQAYNRIGKELLPYIVLLIDNFTPVLQIFPQKEDFFKRLTQEGGSYGMYLIATMGTTTGLRYSIQQNVKTKIALQMTDTSEYTSIVGRTGGIIPKNNPGRGLYRNERVMEFQIGLPVNCVNEEKRGDLIRSESIKQKSTWKGSKVVSIKMLPNNIPYGSIAPSGGFSIGLSVKEVSPVIISKNKPHLLLISGKSGCGNTNMIRVLLRQMKVDRGSQILIFGNPDEFVGLSGENVIVTNNGEEFDVFLSKITNELQKRKDSRSKSEEMFPLYILIDGMKKCLDDISQESVNRLNAIAQIGAGMKVMLVAAEEFNSLNPIKESWLILKRMAEAQVLLIGGRIYDHLVIDTGLSTSEKSVSLDDHDALLWLGGKTIKLRTMNSN